MAIFYVDLNVLTPQFSVRCNTRLGPTFNGILKLCPKYITLGGISKVLHFTIIKGASIPMFGGPLDTWFPLWYSWLISFQYWVWSHAMLDTYVCSLEENQKCVQV